jgi:3-hydroxyanthranilate 3,4-dioxygenase
MMASAGPSLLSNGVDVREWVRRSNAAGPGKPILNFEQFWDDAFLIRLFDGPTPRTRRDFHINSCAELFFQLQGELTTVLEQNGEFVTQVCREGCMFWIPPRVPHLNQREPGSIGVVIHGQRQPGAKDAMVWYCEGCKTELHRVEYDFEQDLRALLAPRVKAFQAAVELRTCKHCGTVMSDDLGFS